jgi:hypothetical protein
MTLAELYSCSSVLVEIMKTKIGYFTEEISKQNFEGTAWIPLSVQ